jgi:hypothetical protein
MKKICILMARGIEGCGVTRFNIEFANYLKSKGHEVSIVAIDDKKWSRRTSHEEAKDIKVFRVKKDVQLQAYYTEVLSHDIVMVASLPSKTHDPVCISVYEESLVKMKEKGVKIVLIQHDHSIHSIVRNASLEKSIQMADTICAHSKTNAFCEKIRKTVPEKDGTVWSFQPGMDFEAVKSKYWKSIESQDAFHAKWIGRTTTWKGFTLVRQFHEQALRQAGFVTTMEGLDKGPAYLVFKDQGPSEVTFEKDKNVYAFGGYNHEELLERLSLCGFGFQLTHMDPKFIERSIEYTHSEVAACGTIPIFHKSYGDVCIHRWYGVPLTQCKDNGTLWLDDTNFAEVSAQMIALANDPVKRDEMRHKAYEFYNLHIDSQYAFAELMEDLI